MEDARFRAFALTAAELLLETDRAGRVLFAAGDLLARLHPPGGTLVGSDMRALVAPADLPRLEMALSRLAVDPRLPPTSLHLALDGMARALTGTSESGRFSLCIAALPPAAESIGQASSDIGGALARQAEALLLQMVDGTGSDDLRPVLSLFELNGAHGRIAPRAALARDIAAVLAEHAGPSAVAAQLAPGRFGVVGAPGAGEPNLGAVIERLQGLLEGAGLQDAAVSTRALKLEASASGGLTGPQAVRALRIALATFAQGGPAALARTGFDGGLDGFVTTAGQRAAVLARAITQHRFSLAFQPIVELARRDQPPSHYEALIRPLPADGLPTLGPQEFVNLVEMLSLSVELDLAVADATLQALARAGGKVRVACNVSGLSLQEPDFRARILALLQRHPAELRGRLLIEVTETAEIDDEREAALSCEALRQLGVTVCVDDFGAGAAGLSYLRLLQPALVKLDGHFTSAAACANGNSDGYTFAAALVELARATGASVVAERIETEAEAATALGFGARYGQGWLFGKPGVLPGSLDARAFGSSARRAANR